MPPVSLPPSVASGQVWTLNTQMFNGWDEMDMGKLFTSGWSVTSNT
jgi:hypothetical protein